MHIWGFILILVYKNSLTPPLCIEVPVPRYDSSAHVFVYRYIDLSLSTTLIFHFGIVLTMWYFFPFFAYSLKR